MAERVERDPFAEIELMMAEAATVARVRRPPTYKAPQHDILGKLPEIVRMSKNGLKPTQIFANLGYSPDVMSDLLTRYQKLSDAILQGRAMGAAEIADVMYRTALAGDPGLIKFYLERRGGFDMPKERGAPKEAPRDLSQDGAVIDLSHVARLQADHTALLDALERGESIPMVPIGSR